MDGEPKKKASRARRVRKPTRPRATGKAAPPADAGAAPATGGEGAAARPNAGLFGLSLLSDTEAAADPVLVEALRGLAEHREREQKALEAGRRALVIETFTAVFEPQWLGQAKEVYRHLGTVLYLLSHHPGVPFELSPHVRAECEADAKKLVAEFRGADPTLTDFYRLLRLVDAYVSGDPLFEKSRALIAAGKTTGAETVAVAAAVLDRQIALRLVEDAACPALLAQLIERWPDRRPPGGSKRAPRVEPLVTKWALAAALLKALTGHELKPKSVRDTYLRRIGRRERS